MTFKVGDVCYYTGAPDDQPRIIRLTSTDPNATYEVLDGPHSSGYMGSTDFMVERGYLRPLRDLTGTYCTLNRGRTGYIQVEDVRSGRVSYRWLDGSLDPRTRTGPLEGFVSRFTTVPQRKESQSMSSADSTLTVRKDRVLEAAASCSTARATLKALFPEVFEPPPLKLVGTLTVDNTKSAVEVRTIGSLKRRAFWLNSAFEWAIEIDDEGAKCLVPTRKS